MQITIIGVYGVLDPAAARHHAPVATNPVGLPDATFGHMRKDASP